MREVEDMAKMINKTQKVSFSISTPYKVGQNMT